MVGKITIEIYTVFATRSFVSVASGLGLSYFDIILWLLYKIAMTALQPVTAQEVVEILLQEPHRITKDVLPNYYAPGNRSFARAQDEIVECGRFNDVQIDQILRTYERVVHDEVMGHLLDELNKNLRPEEQAYNVFEFDLEEDKRAFLGLTVTFEGAGASMKIAEGNLVVPKVRDALLKKLEFYFPHQCCRTPKEKPAFMTYARD